MAMANLARKKLRIYLLANLSFICLFHARATVAFASILHQFHTDRVSGGFGALRSCSWLALHEHSASFSPDFLTGPVVEDLESRSLRLAATIVSRKLARNGFMSSNTHDEVSPLARGRFYDLCCTKNGIDTLESMFLEDHFLKGEDDCIIAGAVMCIQSLAVLGMQYGLKGTTPNTIQPIMKLSWAEILAQTESDLVELTTASTERVKPFNDRQLGQQLLAELKWKRSAQGAFTLMVEIGAWGKHENLELLRSGFPIHFSGREIEAASELINTTTIRDPDAILGIREDLTNQKVYTIDGASALEIDDGLGCERFCDKLGVEKLRYWIHIADADRWIASQPSLLSTAQNRLTSHYLPEGPVPMFPLELGKAMSLQARNDSYALSLGVELAPDGSIIEESVRIVPSRVRVSYRLTYDDVDEMLVDGVGFSEEWQLGALFSAAQLRRSFRAGRGSLESFVPNQIPRFSVDTFKDADQEDGIGISMHVGVSHNSGKNLSATAEVTNEKLASKRNEALVSSASLLVTEMMILAGEAICKWKLHNQAIVNSTTQQLHEAHSEAYDLQLPFRSQPQPDFRSRRREKKIMLDLLGNNLGEGLCHAWYSRRFLSPVKIDTKPLPHFGLGLECYCQWTSPIRRFSDLRVHIAVKRWLRRQKVEEFIRNGRELPDEFMENDLEMSLGEFSADGLEAPAANSSRISKRPTFSRAARMLQRGSEQYWMLEYIRRKLERNEQRSFEALVLGCTNPSRKQYAIYIFDLGLEWKYICPAGNLQAGMSFNVEVASVLPRNGQLTFVRV